MDVVDDEEEQHGVDKGCVNDEDATQGMEGEVVEVKDGYDKEIVAEWVEEEKDDEQEDEDEDVDEFGTAKHDDDDDKTVVGRED